MKVCGLDVHKDTIFCGVHNGKQNEAVLEYSTLTSSIRTMGESLKEQWVESIGEYECVLDPCVEHPGNNGL